MSKLVSSDCLGPLGDSDSDGISSDPLDWGGPGVPIVGQQQLEAGVVILRGGPGDLVMTQLVGRGGRA